jgi:hypothetical protein
MTPARLVTLVTRALGRKPQSLELDVWRDALSCPPASQCPPADCVHDQEADTALRTHIAQSTYPATPADVRRIAISLANQRVEAQLRAEREADIAGAVPPTPEYLAAAAEFRQRVAERTRELEGHEPPLSREQIRARIDAEQQDRSPEAPRVEAAEVSS